MNCPQVAFRRIRQWAKGTTWGRVSCSATVLTEAAPTPCHLFPGTEPYPFSCMLGHVVNQARGLLPLQGNPARRSRDGHWKKAKQFCLQQLPALIHTSPQTCVTMMARQKLFKPMLLPRKCTWEKWDQSSLLRQTFSFFPVSNRSDGFND